MRCGVPNLTHWRDRAKYSKPNVTPSDVGAKCYAVPIRARGRRRRGGQNRLCKPLRRVPHGHRRESSERLRSRIGNQIGVVGTAGYLRPGF
jgi:hypothetical protein